MPQLIKDNEILKLSRSWQRAIFPKHILGKGGVTELDFNLDLVKGKVKLSKKTILKPFETVIVLGIGESKQHQYRVGVMMERT